MTDHPYQHNIQHLTRSDLGGRPDACQVMVHRGYAYVGHIFNGGFSVIDVRDPRRPQPIKHIAGTADTWNIHLQTHGDLLMVISEANLYLDRQNDPAAQYEAGLRIYDISEPTDPKPISFFEVDGSGVHRLWYDGGQHAYLATNLRGYTGHQLQILDVSDPEAPAEAGRWWLPGMWDAGGEEPTWPADRNYALHHAVVADGMAYCPWKDGGLVLVDVSDPSSPALVGHRNWSPPFGGNAHDALPLSDRGLTIVLNEGQLDECGDPEKYIWVVDTREPSNPVTISRFPLPDDADYCGKGGKAGPHGLWENRSDGFQSEDLIIATHNNAGVRVYDIHDQYRPVEVGAFVPGDPADMADPRPDMPRVIQSLDVYVDKEGLIYVTDPNAGLDILEYKGA